MRERWRLADLGNIFRGRWDLRNTRKTKISKMNTVLNQTLEPTFCESKKEAGARVKPVSQAKAWKTLMEEGSVARHPGIWRSRAVHNDQ